MGLLAPSTPRLQPELIDVDELTDLSDAEAARTTSELAKGSVSVVEWLQQILHPWTSYVIVPIFALANSGISISVAELGNAAGSPITWGVLLGLLLGKPLGGSRHPECRAPRHRRLARRRRIHPVVDAQRR